MPATVTYRAVVDPADCDFLGHMNVSRYFAACSDGVFALQSEIGMTTRDMANGRMLSFVVVHAESDFRSELTAGEAIFLETEVLGIGARSVTFRHRLYRTADRSLTFESVFKCVMMSLRERAATAIPDEIRDQLAARMGAS